MGGLFFNGNEFAGLVILNHAKAVRVLDLITEECRALGLGRSFDKHRSKALTVENVGA